MIVNSLFTNQWFENQLNIEEDRYSNAVGTGVGRSLGMMMFAATGTALHRRSRFLFHGAVTAADYKMRTPSNRLIMTWGVVVVHEVSSMDYL